MLSKLHLTKFSLIAGAVLAVSTFGAPAQADSGGVQVGVLSCNVSSGWGFIFGSSREVKCTFSGTAKSIEHYAGHIGKFGVDIGYLQSAVIVWAVFAPATDLAPGALAGGYGGVTGGASVGIGAGANVLIGGSNKSITLQPVSIEGNSGLNVAAGIAALKLDYQPNPN